MLACFKTADKVPILYIDGAPHPLKAAKIAERQEKCDQALSKLRALQLTGDPNKMDDIKDLMKTSSYTRHDILYNVKAWSLKNQIIIIGCPLEFDFQAAADCDAIMTTDSDLFVLGAKSIVDNIHFIDD